MTYLPVFQAQNPAISGYALGWSSCTAFAAAMAADYDTLGRTVPSGRRVRELTGDTTGGLTLAQVDRALRDGWGIDLDVRYALPWAEFVRKIDAGHAAVLQHWYGPIADSRFDAGRGFRGNHAGLVLPGWRFPEPLADGRAAGVYRFNAGDTWPRTLLRTAAGRLNLGSTTYRALGDGLVYAAFTRDQTVTYRLRWSPGSFWLYEVRNNAIVGRQGKRILDPKGTGAPCGAPRLTPWPGHSSRVLVRVLAGVFAGGWVAIPQSTVRLIESR